MANQRFWQVAVLTAAGSLGAASQADAALFNWQDSDPGYYRPAPGAPTRKPRARKPSTGKNDTAEKETGAKPQGPLVINVSIEKQRVRIYDTNGLFAESPVSTGMKGHSTPMGVFSIIQKHKMHHSNIYSGAPMPFMQRITWSGIALHAGNLPGYPASHGCIRLPFGFAEQLWGMTRMGMRVVVTNDTANAVSFQHPRLPTPTFTRAPVVVPTAKSDGLPATLAAAAPTLAVPAAAAEAEERLLNPMERAAFEKTKSAAAVVQAKLAAVAALEASRAASAEADDALATVRRAQAAVASARSRAPGKDQKVASLADPSVTQDRVDTPEYSAELTLDQAMFDLDEAMAARAALNDVAFMKAREARDAEGTQERTETAARLAAKGLEPISVFISRKERRLYVRQGFEPIYEADVAIADEAQPLGTHLFVAVEPREGGSAMSWTAVNVPGGAASFEPAERRARGAARDEPRVPRAAATGVGSAVALERITIPAEALEFISTRLWTGAALTVSDWGISSETGKGTDFVVLTK